MTVKEILAMSFEERRNWWVNSGRYTPPPAGTFNTPELSLCRFEGCEDFAKRKTGFCYLHQARFEKHGHPNAINPRKPFICYVLTCTQFTHTKFCEKHEKEAREYGEGYK